MWEISSIIKEWSLFTGEGVGLVEMRLEGQFFYVLHETDRAQESKGILGGGDTQISASEIQNPSPPPPCE